MVAIRRLMWDPVNVAHIAKHGVGPVEVEEVCRAKHIALRSRLSRIVVIGQTTPGRALTIILEGQAETETYYVVTARPASRKERRPFREQMEGQTE